MQVPIQRQHRHDAAVVFVTGLHDGAVIQIEHAELPKTAGKDRQAVYKAVQRCRKRAQGGVVISDDIFIDSANILRIYALLHLLKYILCYIYDNSLISQL